MEERVTNLDSTCTAAGSPRRQLVDVLESYLADLERGVAPDEQALLAAHPELAGELRPYLDSLRLLHGATRDLRAAKVSTNGATVEGGQPSGRQIGEYRIVREIGRGGMGIVYEAHQKSLNRRVALKILPFAAVLDQRQIARFRNEAQAAAQLHHPHIVPVFAVGQEQGVYYYAMQFIDGQSLEQAIDELRIGGDERGQRSTKVAGAARGSTTTMHAGAVGMPAGSRSIRGGDFFQTVARLGREAAEALQHAHENGIVHRDIKPSNLLLDEQGKLWVTDFGLARMQSDSGVTLTGDVVGTLRYMSPEQAAGGGVVVDARTDVYSLGVTMYELLTGQRAHRGDDRQTLLRQIVSDEPISPRRLNPAVPLDLETIVLGAMAKSRDERYASAQALADDLERFVTGKPTLARRPTLTDRVAKWARRHRSLVAVAALAVVLLSVVSAVGMAMLARAQARTAAALARAEKDFERAKHFSEQWRSTVDQFGMGLADRLTAIPGAETVRRDLLVDTLSSYQKFAAEAGDDPKLRHELALAHFKSGGIAAKLGAMAEAMKEYETAGELLKELTRSDPSLAETQAQLAVTHNNLGLLLAARGDVAAARQHYAAAIDLQQRLTREHADDPTFASQLAESEANLGMLLDQTGDAAGAERALRAAVDVLRELAESRSNEPKYARNLAIACNNLSYVLRTHDPASAERASREAIARLERLAQDSPAVSEFQDDLALCYNNLAALEGQQEHMQAAIDWYQRAIALQEQLARKSPAVVRHRSDLAVSFNNLGVAYCRAERVADADAAFGQARELLATLADDYPDETAYASSLAALLNNQALALADAGRHDEALKIYPTAIASQRTCWEKMPQSPLMCDVLSRMMYNQGQSLRQVGRLAEATAVAISRREVWQGNGVRLFGVAVELAEIAQAAGEQQTDGAEADKIRHQLAGEVVATLRQSYNQGWPEGTDLAEDERFAYLKDNEQFEKLLAEMNTRTGNAGASRRDAGTQSTGTTDSTNTSN